MKSAEIPSAVDFAGFDPQGVGAAGSQCCTGRGSTGYRSSVSTIDRAAGLETNTRIWLDADRSPADFSPGRMLGRLS